MVNRLKYYKIVELEKNKNLLKKVQDFLFNMMKKEYGYGYIPEYHYDIKNLKEIYLSNERNNFFIAQAENKNILGTIAIRGHDQNFKELRDLYSKESTDNVWRLFVDENFRRLGIASELVRKMEEFSRKKHYKIISYTQKY
ncbi:hypothetical protein ALNOE001_05660 [Candidatus Methanobinarius endosymbioticus]|uniref:N-acetyltransferase domain-containing protein n=1 Tax=Candidatus Methanobinarius endosymbioticus TaxID=2006182 RepID=A0A366MEX5_9EURY|nr:hypothetical protein ALNOE001_05660 [Candidatus Methanobinarius endosymbioticus]